MYMFLYYLHRMRLDGRKQSTEAYEMLTTSFVGIRDACQNRKDASIVVALA
jgi:hypothetical protein